MRAEAAGRDRPGGSGPQNPAGAPPGPGGIAPTSPRGAAIAPEGPRPGESPASRGGGGVPPVSVAREAAPVKRGKAGRAFTPLGALEGRGAGGQNSARAGEKGRSLPFAQWRGLCPPSDLPATRPPPNAALAERVSGQEKGKEEAHPRSGVGVRRR